MSRYEDPTGTVAPTGATREVDGETLLPQLVAHLREHRTRLRQEWVGRIQEAHLLQAMTAHLDRWAATQL